MRTRTTLGTIALITALVACGDDTATPKDAAADQPQAIDTGTEVKLDVGVDLADVQLNDGQILAVAEKANEGEIALGAQAEGSASDQQVKQFAHQMQIQHSNANTRLITLSGQQSIVAAGSMVWQQLVDTQTAAEATLFGKTGAAYDVAYMESQVKGHQEIIKLLDEMLLDVQNAALKTELQTERADAQTHLTQALALLAQLQADAGVPADGAVD